MTSTMQPFSLFSVNKAITYGKNRAWEGVNKEVLTSLRSNVTSRFLTKCSANSGYISSISRRSSRWILCKSQYVSARTLQLDLPIVSWWHMFSPKTSSLPVIRKSDERILQGSTTQTIHMLFLAWSFSPNDMLWNFDLKWTTKVS